MGEWGAGFPILRGPYSYIRAPIFNHTGRLVTVLLADHIPICAVRVAGWYGWYARAK